MKAPDELKNSTYSIDFLGLLLIFLSSVLLGIWAVKNTIALRNGILILGAILGIAYLILNFKDRNFRPRLSIMNFLPLIMLGLMFIWVILHFIFLGRFPEQQLSELSSTWLRAFLGACLAIGTALVVSKKNNLTGFLWLGIFVSFLILVFQYARQALADNVVNLTSHYGPAYLYYAYIYLGKINAVLVGTIMISGLLGSATYVSLDRNKAHSKIMILYCFLGLILSAASYVFVLDSRNGIGLEILVLLIAALFFLLHSFSEVAHSRSRKSFRAKFGFYVTSYFFWMILIVGILVVALAIQHIRHNPTWSTMATDVRAALDINKYENWQDVESYGLPQTPDGKVSSVSTYQRIAWVVASTKIFIPENPFGIGILKHSFPRLLYEKYGKSVDDSIPSTHSAWIDLTLSYGLPGLFLLLGALVLVVWKAVKQINRNPLSSLIFVMGFSLMLLYGVGEVAVGHGLEILIYMISFLGALTIFPELSV